jgi:hypothetical protein
MVDAEAHIREELEALAPLSPEGASWEDALRRARERGGATGGAPKHRHGRKSLVFALIAFVLIAGAALAVTLVGRKDVPFATSRHAPSLVKKRFLDLAIGAPASMRPDVLAGQAREVGEFKFRGRTRKLWVAPTRRGGYCFTFERWFGGCRQTAADRARVIGASWMLANDQRTRRRQVIVAHVGGDITDPRAARLVAQYADGMSDDIEFVWVSAPIRAGFFSFEVPAAHKSDAHRLKAITLYSSSDKILGSESFAPFVPLPPRSHPPHAPIINPTHSVAPPAAPFQHASAKGVTVLAGHNESVRFDLRSLDASLRPLIRRGAGFVCARLTREFGIFTVRGSGYPRALAPEVTLRYSGVGTPYDFCEIQGQYGHRWPDRFASHSAVEIPFTAKGRAFFADRAAARDLALFIRSREMHRLRKQSGDALARALRQTYGAKFSRSHIEFEPSARGGVFSERSETGKLFRVVIEDGRITRQNLKPYAFVF